jgi:ABC-2 type transport system ATP-binding protein
VAVAQWVATVRGLSFVKNADLLPDDEDGSSKLVITLDNPAEQNPAIINALVGQGAQIQFVNELKHSLEDVYLSLIQNNATL